MPLLSHKADLKGRREKIGKEAKLATFVDSKTLQMTFFFKNIVFPKTHDQVVFPFDALVAKSYFEKRGLEKLGKNSKISYIWPTSKHQKSQLSHNKPHTKIHLAKSSCFRLHLCSYIVSVCTNTPRQLMRITKERKFWRTHRTSFLSLLRNTKNSIFT